MPGIRWVVGVGALLLALAALFVLLSGGELRPGMEPIEGSSPALDDIDARSRAAMRDLLREAGDEE